VDQRIGHLAGADPFQVKPRHQVLDRLGLAQVTRQNLGGEAETHAVLIDAAVVHARLVNLDRTDAAQDRPWRLVTVAHHQAVIRFIDVMLVGLDVIGDFVLDRLLQCPPRSLAGDLFDGQTNDRLGCQPQGKCG
jgi:hypothetical protein